MPNRGDSAMQPRADIRSFGPFISSNRETAVLNVTSPIRASLFLASFLASCVFCAFATGQSDDWHLSENGAKALFARSAFAHGYMHGYEEGFHNGDLDLQMGRSFREVKNQEKFKKPCGYRADFGDRGTFEAGYRKGYSVGYIDSYSGRAFRAMQLVHLARNQDSTDAATHPDRQFDRAFIAGYEAGQQFGLKDGRSEVKAAALDSVACGAVGEHADGLEPQYCAAYQSGYQLGYSDGYSNQREAGQIFARK